MFLSIFFFHFLNFKNLFFLKPASDLFLIGVTSFRLLRLVITRVSRSGQFVDSYNLYNIKINSNCIISSSIANKTLILQCAVVKYKQDNLAANEKHDIILNFGLSQSADVVCIYCYYKIIFPNNMQTGLLKTET